MATYSEIPLNERPVVQPVPLHFKSSVISYPRPLEQLKPAIPSAYSSKVSYGSSTTLEDDPDMYYEERDRKKESFSQVDTDTESLKSRHSGVKLPQSPKPTLLISYLSKSRYYIRGLAIMVMIITLTLILTGIIKFAIAQNDPGHPLDSVPKNAPITDHPCIVFSGIAGMNLVLSGGMLLVSYSSNKFRKSTNAVSATFTILSAVGFSTSMGACFLLNSHSTLENDLWKWSCVNHQQGITTSAMDFGQVCNVIAYSWRFGLLQASLELLTFLISVMVYIFIKYSNFARYGRFGKYF